MVLSDDALVSDPVDPLVDCSFFPFTSSSLFPPRPNPNFDSHLKNMVAKNPDSLVNQARSILDNGVEPVVGDKTTATASEDQSEVTITVNDKNPRERRPGLGHKRAKFSVKPIPSQPDMSLVPDLDIAKLKDPVEFFSAFERMENAKKELLKLKGQPLEAIDLNRAALPPRRRKPSIYRKKAVFKPRPYSLTGDPDNDDMSSDEPYDHDIMSLPRANATPNTAPMKASPQMRVSDVKPTMSSQVSELDELLSYDYEGLDEDGVQNFLKKKLNIKIIDTDVPSLPVMPDVHRREYGSLIEALPSMNDSIFDADDSSKATSSKLLNFSYQFRKNPSNQVPPPLSKSPLASISMLNKHLSRLTALKDPFLTLDVDSSPEVVPYAKAQNRKQAEYNSNMIDLPETSRLPENDEATNEAVTSPLGLVRKNATPNIEFEDRLNDGHSDPVLTTKSHEFGRSATGGNEDIGVDGENLPSVTAQNIAPTDDSENCLDKIRQTTQDSNLFEIRSPTDGAANNVGATKATTEEDQITFDPESVGKGALSEDSPLEKAIVSGVDSEMGEPLSTQGILIEKPKKKKATSKSKHKDAEESTTLQENIHEETLNKGKKGKAKSNAAVLEEPKKKGKSKRKEPEESAPPQQENICEETVNKGKKGKAQINAVVLKEPKNKKWKVESPLALPSPVERKLRRHSLYAAGSKWEGKRRQSTRIRMRPLEFWRGERFLYGRVHDSVVSVIGVKYASPTKDAEEPAVKVKSFVSDKYKDLVDLASYH